MLFFHVTERTYYNDLAAEQPERVKVLYAELEAWWKDTGAKFPVRNPNFDASKWWQLGAGKEE